MQDLDTRAGTMLNGTASGMIPMAIFTPVYAIWPVFAWPVFGTVFCGIAVAFAIFLFVTGIRTLRISKELPDGRNAADARIAKTMPIISNIMGVGILVSIVVLVLLDLPVWILPTVVTLVALHFYPMARLFHRPLDYFLATFMLAAAAIGFALAGLGHSWQTVWGYTGLLAASVTALYGLNAVLSARRVLSAYKSNPSHG